MKRFATLSILMLSLTALLPAQDLYDEELIDTYDEDAMTLGETFARLTFAGRDVAVLHDNGERQEATVNYPLAAGDLLETGYQSFAEMEFIDGSLMQFGHRSKVEFQAINENYDNNGLLTVIRLFEGMLMVHVTDQSDTFGDRLFRIDTEAGSAYIESPGIYSVEQAGDRMQVKVYRGLAELAGERGSRLIKSGEYANIHDFDRPTFPIPFNAFRGGSFERWAYERRPGGFGVSSKYVDRSISVYSRDLDDHGRWRYHRELDTHVWVPYVKTSWRPYWNGFWTRSGVSLTWVSYDPFGWVTHHYGRWSYHSDWGYYWVPKRYYAPAWVAWTSYDSYVGWCPLGMRNRPYYYGVSINIGRHHNHWNYIPAHSIVIGRRNYSERRAVPRHRRKIVINNVYVTRDDLRDGDVLTRVISQPKLNRERRNDVASRRGYLVSRHSNEATRHAVKIQSRDSGTRAKPRFSTRVRPSDGASILTSDRSSTRKSDGATTSRSNDGSSILQRNRSSERSASSREPLSPLPGRTETRETKRDDRGQQSSRSTTQSRETKRDDRGQQSSRSTTQSRETKRDDRGQQSSRSTTKSRETKRDDRGQQSSRSTSRTESRQRTEKKEDQRSAYQQRYNTADRSRSRSQSAQSADRSQQSRSTSTVKRSDSSRNTSASRSRTQSTSNATRSRTQATSNATRSRTQATSNSRDNGQRARSNTAVKRDNRSSQSTARRSSERNSSASRQSSTSKTTRERTQRNRNE